MFSKKEMKVVFLHNDFKVYWRGRLFYLKHYLQHYGISMNVIEIFGQGSAYSFDRYTNKVNWWECLFPDDQFVELNNKIVRRKIHKRLNEINPDFVISGGVAFTSGAVGLQWVKRNKKKIVVFDDIKHSMSRRSIINVLIKKTLTAQADAFLVPSHNYDEEYLKWGINREKLYYGLNCVNNHYYNNMHRGRTGNFKTITSIARLVPVKNFDGLLRAWKDVELKCLNYRLIIVGDGPEFINLKILSEDLQLVSVLFLGAYNIRDTRRILSESDAFILPSFSESWGMVVNEAMASGLPVILSNRINASSTLVVDGENGFLFDPYRVDEIALTIIKFINTTSEMKSEMSRNAKKSVKKFSYRYLAKEIIRAISDMNNLSFSEPNPIVKLLIQFWNGKFITDGWFMCK
jgi:glycosyltransferase involved in cell wall biosynthesis